MNKGLKIFCFGLATCAMASGVALVAGCKNGEAEKKDGISVSTSFEDDYYQGQDLDVTGGVLAYTKDGETVNVNITADMVSNFDSSKLGQSAMTITYEGYTTTVNYTVKETGLVGKTFSNKDQTAVSGGMTTFCFFPSYDTLVMGHPTGGSTNVSIQYKPVVEDGELTLVGRLVVPGQFGENTLAISSISNITESGFREELSAYSLDENGNAGTCLDTSIDQYGIVTNGSLSEVSDNLYVIAYPNKTEYKAGEELDVTGCYILSVKDGNWTIVALTEDMVTRFNRVDDSFNMIISYNGQTTTIICTVSE